MTVVLLPRVTLTQLSHAHSQYKDLRGNEWYKTVSRKMDALTLAPPHNHHAAQPPGGAEGLVDTADNRTKLGFRKYE